MIGEVNGVHGAGQGMMMVVESAGVSCREEQIS
jgi:hypothetical protein